MMRMRHFFKVTLVLLRFMLASLVKNMFLSLF